MDGRRVQNRYNGWRKDVQSAWPLQKLFDSETMSFGFEEMLTVAHTSHGQDALQWDYIGMV